MRFGAGVLLLASAIYAVESLEKVVVNPVVTPAKQTDESVYTGVMIDNYYGAKSSAYEALDLISGVTVDRPSQLASEEGSIKIRGINSSFGALSVEGVPNSGLGPIGARDYIYDMENIESVLLYKSTAPVDVGLGIGTRGGAIDLKPKWAKDQSGASFKQSLGSDKYKRTFGRIDSGKIDAINTAFSGSFSYTDADKFKGPGKLGERKNLNFTAVTSIGETDLKLWFNHNDHNKDSYRGLDLATANSRPNTDFIDNPTSNFHYKYNRSHLKNSDLIVVAKGSVGDYQISFKPYYSRERSDSTYKMDNPNVNVQNRTRDMDRIGSLINVSRGVSDLNLSAGYHYEHSDVAVESNNYKFNGAGKLVYQNSMYATDGVTHTHSPYLKVAYASDDLSVQFGSKYFVFKDSDLTNADSALSRKGKTYSLFLPNAGISYKINGGDEIYLNYGRSFVRPYSYAPLVSVYRANKAAFQAAGITAQDLFDGNKVEESDNIDLGYRFVGEDLQFSPTIFYGKHKKLLTTIKRAGVNYQQSVGKATSYGVEADLSYFLDDALVFFVAPTYMVFEYDNDILGKPTKGNQVVNIPKTTVKTGIIYQDSGFKFVPTAKYVSKRYGDAQHKEKVDSHIIYDALFEYKQKVKGYNLAFNFEVKNIFDKDYISAINASDDAMSGKATYTIGAPRTFMGYVGVEF